jgi:hypothetical protein
VFAGGKEPLAVLKTLCGEFTTRADIVAGCGCGAERGALSQTVPIDAGGNLTDRDRPEWEHTQTRPTGPDYRHMVDRLLTWRSTPEKQFEGGTAVRRGKSRGRRVPLPTVLRARGFRASMACVARRLRASIRRVPRRGLKAPRER